MFFKHLNGKYQFALVLSLCVFCIIASAEADEHIEINAPARIAPVKAPFDIRQFQRPRFQPVSFNIINYGAVPDGITKNTAAFTKTIEACHAAGGGTVVVPKGKYLTGPIHLKSNVNLHLEAQAEVHFSNDPNDYLPVVFTRWAGFELYNYSPLIYARDCQNIAVTGPGKLFGHGQAWWHWKKRGEQTARKIYNEQVLKNIDPRKRIYGKPEQGLRPQFISPINCKNVLLEGFTVATGGPFWTFDIIYCDGVIIRDLHVNTIGGPNNDGINLDSSRNVLVEYCYVHSEDDSIALKSGINEEGWRVGKPTENIVVRHIKTGHGHGGIVIGSEMSGGVRNVYVHDCYFGKAQMGIRLKSNASRGGVVENIWYENIDIGTTTGEAIRINTNYGAYMASINGKAYPTFRNIHIKNVTCENSIGAAISMKGTENKPLENITLENVLIKSQASGAGFFWINGLKLKNVKCKTLKGQDVTFENCKDVVRQQ